LSDPTTTAKKALSAVDLTLSAIGLLKSFALIFGVVFIQWARARQKLAENKTAVAETDLKVTLAAAEIQRKADAKDPDAIISDFLGGK